MENIKCAYCGIKVIPAELDFKVDEGWPYVPAKQTMRVEREGSGELFPSWNAIVDTDWVGLNPSHSDKEATIVVSVHSIGKPAGDYEAKVTFTSQEATNTPVYATIKLTVTPKPVPTPPLKIITISLPDGEMGKAYECQLEAEGGMPPYIWTCTGIPDGLVFYVMPTPQISGTPTFSGDFPITIAVNDSNNNPVSTVLGLHIAALPAKVAITSPVGGEIWYVGDVHDITWVSDDGEGQTLNIELFYNGNSILIAGVSIKALMYSWQIVEGVSEDAIIRLVTIDRVVESGPFAIKEHSGCAVPWPLAKLLNKLRR
jgi:hypothetical protein